MPFQDYVKYPANFEKLNQRITDVTEQKKYVDLWKSRYAAQFENNAPEEVFLWTIRVHKSLKEVFCASAMYEESLVAKESCSWTSFYFLSYYSLFHAFLSCVYFLPNESLEKLSEITHSKLLNIFKANFCNEKPNIIDGSVCDAFSILKYLREYYSYHMPPNQFLYEHKDNIKPDIVLPEYLKSCFQLASLLSDIVECSSDKHHKVISDRGKYYNYVKNYYCMVNCRRHPITNRYLLHYVDEVRIKEIFEYPSPISFVNDFEHYSDEFGMYGGSSFPLYMDGTEILPSNFVYSAIF